MHLAVSWSGGKDSMLACHDAIRAGHDVTCLLNLISKGSLRCCFHGLDNGLIRDQAGAVGIPLLLKEMSEGMNDYEREFKEVLSGLKDTGIDGVVFGDIYLDEHREWVERVCGDAGLAALEPLWGMEAGKTVGEFIARGFKAVVVSCREELGEDFVGRTVDGEMIEELKAKNICPCGENGEYHTLVVDGPIFKRRIDILEVRSELRDGFWRHWFLDIKSYGMRDKNGF
ncbi:MAG: diphthine--ammonia ligase [Spirochaetes bacterium]|jgi:uncharacterized protein (TIGR00290 family)|nr:diphthine--ammonia ligase [Spirochaetota bacterium]